MNTNTQEALAKVASLSEALEAFARNISRQRITVYPITMMGNYDDLLQEEIDKSTYQHDYHDDTLTMIEGENEGHCCSGCMDCLGLSWTDFV